MNVQHVVPSVVPPITSGLLLLAVALGQFDREALLFPFGIVLFLPPIGRIVWSFTVRRPVVSGVLDQRLFGADILLMAVALLQPTSGAGSPLVLLLYGAACYLGLLQGPYRFLPAAGIAAGALLLSSIFGSIDGGILGTIAPLIGLAGFAFLPSIFFGQVQEEAQQAQLALESIERTARGIEHDADRQQQQVRHASHAKEDVQADLRALTRRLQETLNSTCQVLVEATGADRCLIFRPTREGDSLGLVATNLQPGAVVKTVHGGEGVFGAARKAGGSLLMPSIEHPYSGLVYTSEPTAVHNVMVAPLVRDGEPWGVLVMDATRAEMVTPRDRRLVEGIVPLLLSLLQQLVELRAYRQDSGEDKQAHETSQALASQGGLDGLAEVLVERSQQMLEAHATALVMLQDDASLKVLQAVGFDQDPVGTRFPFDKTVSLVAQAIRYETPLIQTGLGGHRKPPTLFGTEFGPAGRFTDVMIVPLMTPGSDVEPRRCLGALCLCRSRNQPFQDKDKDRVLMLANQAASHLLNIRLLEDSKQQAATDGLTGLPNRRAFAEKLDEMLQRAARFTTPVSLLILDLDHFKKVNDTYGHPVGDQVLRRLSALLRESIREAVDMAARYGGEEFAILLENTSHDGALKLAERLRKAFSEETFIHMEGSHAQQFKCTMSLGVASYPEAGDALVLVEKADQALYEAKQDGRNKVMSYKGEGPGKGSPLAPI